MKAEFEAMTDEEKEAFRAAKKAERGGRGGKGGRKLRGK